MKFGISPSPHIWWKHIKEFENWISIVEGCGYDAIFLQDHYGLPAKTGGRLPISEFPSNELLDAWSTLSYIAARTKSIKIGTCVTPLPRYVPSQLAKVISTVDLLSSGRVIVGLGAGWFPDEFVNYSPQGSFEEPRVRVERFLEGLYVMIKLWTEDKVTFNGKYYKLRDAVLMPKPKQKPYPPLWSGGLGPRMLRITAKYFDAWFPPKGGRGASTPELYEQGVKTVKKYLNKYGRDVNKFIFALLSWPTGKLDNEINVIEKYQHAGCQYYVVDITPSLILARSNPIKLARKFAKEVIPSF